MLNKRPNIEDLENAPIDSTLELYKTQDSKFAQIWVKQPSKRWKLAYFGKGVPSRLSNEMKLTTYFKTHLITEGK